MKKNPAEGLTLARAIGTHFNRVLATPHSHTPVNSTQEVIEMKFRPLHDRILVERVESEEKTVGGLYLPDTAKEKPQQGKIIAVGAGKRTEDGKLIPEPLTLAEIILVGMLIVGTVIIGSIGVIVQGQIDKANTSDPEPPKP